MKRIASILLVLVMLLSLTACGGKEDSQPSGSKPNTGAVSGGNDSKPSKEDKNPAGPVEIVDHVKAAMESNRHLTTSNYLLAKDGTILAMREEFNDENALIYAKMPNVKKLCVSASGSKVLALTEDNCLYQGGTKIAENVTDVAYATTNSNEAGRVLSGSDIFRHDSMGMGGAKNEYFLQHKSGGNVRISGTPAYIGVEKHDFIVITETGDVYLDSSNEAYTDHEVFGWKNMAMVDIARDVENGDLVSLTVAGIQGDGTVVATGDYAADILGWGELSYIAMDDTIIAGLKKDGTVKITGLVGTGLQEIVAGWSNIVAIEAGYGARFGEFVSAMDADGNFYYARFYQNSYEGCKVSVDDGVSPRMQARKYTPDGKAFYTNGDGAWEEATDD